MHDDGVMDEFFDQGQKDPEFFCKEALGSDLWPVQVQILESVRDNPVTAVPSCHASGKTFTAGQLVLWFLFCYPHAKVITTAPTHRQVQALLWGEIASAHARAPMPLGGALTNTDLTIAPDWYAIGFTAPDYDPNRFQGFHAPNVLVVVDEAAGITTLIMDQISSLLSGGHCRKLEIGNPVETGTPFEQSCQDEMVSVIPINAFDTPNFTKFGITEKEIADGTWKNRVGELPFPMLITPEWVADRYRVWGPDTNSYRSRILGEFPSTSEGAFYGTPMETVEREGRICHLPVDPGYPVHTAWDIGIRDESAIWFYQKVDNWIHLVDYYEASGMGLQHYVQVVKDKGHIYGLHTAPPDMKVRDFGTGQSRVARASDLGLHFTVLTRTVQSRAVGWMYEGIDAARGMLPRCKFDAERCALGIDHLMKYARKRNPRTGQFLSDPVHDEHSHGADAFRYLAMASRSVGDNAPQARPKPDVRWMT